MIGQHYNIAGFRLSPGDTTLAVYGEDRPSTLYIWKRRQQNDRAYSFNSADAVSLRPAAFLWRDRAVDSFVDNEGTVRVLDEHALPAGLPRELLLYIMKARDEVLARFRNTREEAERLINGKS